MQSDLFYYTAPLLYPVFEAKTGRTVVGLGVGQLIRDASDRTQDVNLTLSFRLYVDGDLLSEEINEISIREAEQADAFFTREFVAPDGRIGYVLVSIEADRPYFRKLRPEVGYGLLLRPDGGQLTVQYTSKFAEPIIIEQVKNIGMFCYSHPAQVVDSSIDAMSSCLIINPYDGPLVARLAASGGRTCKRKVKSRHAVLLPISELLRDGEIGCVMYTGSNRYAAWDVRHSMSDGTDIHNIDHLEFFRTRGLHHRQSLVARAKAMSRYFLRLCDIFV